MLMPSRSPRRFFSAIFLPLLLAVLPLASQTKPDLIKDFQSPPAAARPWVYWFWLNGNITRDGITADLEAMKRAGIGGVLIMEVDQGAPLGPVPFAGPRWRELFKHVCAEADRLGLEVNMNNDAGWCGSGGPWITPELSMQRVVWTETKVQGPAHFSAPLLQAAAVMNYYRDIAVLAFPTPEGQARITSFREKASDVPMDVTPAIPAAWMPEPASQAIPRGRQVNLSERLDSSGRLVWEVPAGSWTILRLGHTTTGKDNHPAPESGRGLECDKLSRTAVEAFFEGLMGKLISDVGPLAGKSLVSTHIDSWEIGSQNWTPKLSQEFRDRRGYDLLPFLPVITGRIVDSREISERFLWDLRQTINELLLANYAGHMRELANRRGIRLSIEAYSNCPTDEMAYAGRADEPMAEFWSWERYGSAWTCTEMASAAHVYGKPIVGAEAFTATDAERWQGHPANIKDIGDWAFCEGINRFVFHRYALQPWLDVKPGMSMGPWGLHYERTQTWWEQSSAWHRYLARCQYLLRQGLFVADICYLGPEGSPQTLNAQKAFLSNTPGQESLPRDRSGYNFDTCPPEVVLERMSVKDGRLVLPDGMSYGLLVLPSVETMTPRLLAKIKELIEAGATVVGSRPVQSPGLAGYPQSDAAVKDLAAQIWGAEEPPAQLTERRIGQGRLFWSTAFQKKIEPVRPASLPLAAAQWIWFPEGDPAEAAPPGVRYFRRPIIVDAGSPIASAQLAMTADNAFSCRINGQDVGSGDDWKKVVVLDAAKFLKPGSNLITIEARNGAATSSPAGLIGALTISYGNGRITTMATDRSWEAAQTAQGPWTAAKELGPLGMEPWGNISPDYADSEIYPRQERVAEVLEKMGLAPDFSFQSLSGTASLRYIHRTMGGTEIFFVANKLQQAEHAVCAFRVRGKRPEFWYPDTGRIEKPAAYDLDGGLIRVPISFDPYGSVFVIFADEAGPPAGRIVSADRNGKPILSTGGKYGPALVQSPIDLLAGPEDGIAAEVREPGSYALKTADGKIHRVEAPAIPQALTLAGPWEVHFAPGGGAPDRLSLKALVSWSKSADPQVKYYSGAATYVKTVSIPPALLAANRGLWLDLGRVEVMAEVRLNGRDLGILWKPPYRVDISEAAKVGDNTLEVKVVNLWINRQIGDEFLPEDSERNPEGTLKVWPSWLMDGAASPAKRETFTSWRLWHKTDALVESGLLGPVRIVPTLKIAVSR